MTRTKICCISSVDEAALVVRLGAHALGLVSEMPSGPGVIDETEIAAIAATVPPAVATVLLTSRTDPEGILEQQRRCGVNTLQLCDAVAPEDHARIRAASPGVAVIQVIHVEGEASVAEACRIAPHVHGLLLDSGRPSAEKRVLGGTGRTHDWELSARIVREAAAPVFLAGGLGPENVAEAIRAVRPYGVDLCTGVRSGDRLDEGKLRRFMDAVRSPRDPGR